MADGELKDHALNSNHDFYDLLGLPTIASETEIRRAYRRTALKYHPDKVGANDTASLEKFHLLQIAYDVLLDSDVRQLYDNARRAREEKKEREAAYEGRRRHLKEELERRESAGAAGLKRKRQESEEEEIFQRELKRLAEDGARRRKEREEQLRKEAQREFEWGEQQRQNGHTTQSDQASASPTIQEMDRTIKFRYLAETGFDQAEIASRFSRFGKIEYVVLKNKKLKVEGHKHRREYTTAMVVFESIVGAHAAVADVARFTESDTPGTWSAFEAVNWATGSEPDCIPKPITPSSRPSLPPETMDKAQPATPVIDRLKGAAVGESGAGLKKVPSFGSFKGTPRFFTTPAKGSPSTEEIMMIRLKNAERKRLAEKLRRGEGEGEGEEEKGKDTAFSELA